MTVPEVPKRRWHHDHTIERSMACVLLAVAVLSLLALPVAEAQSVPSGNFVASRMNQKPLPVTDRVTDSDGVTYFIEFDRLILTIRPGNAFRAALRYRRALDPGTKRTASNRTSPLQSMTVWGRYELVGREIRFIPDPKRGGRGMRILAGTVLDAGRIRLPFTYRNGAANRQATLDLQRRDDIL